MHRVPGRTLARTAILMAALALAGASAASAYVIVLKNGNQIQARDKPVIRDGKAYFTMKSGTETFLSASQIDFTKTEELNKDSAGSNARLLPSRQPEKSEEDEDPKTTLADLARRRQSLSPPPPRGQPEPSLQAMDLASLPKTPAGNLDLLAAPRTDYRDSDVKADILRYLRGQGIDQVAVFQGTRPDRVIVDITTNTEASVFKSIKDTAAALLQLRETYATRVAAIELVLSTDQRVRAGQFTFTPELASDLASGNVGAEAFFLRHVEF